MEKWKNVVEKSAGNSNELIEYIRQLDLIEKKALEIAVNHLGSSFQLDKCNGFINWKRENLLMESFNEIKNKESKIELMRNYGYKNEFYDRNGMFIIFTDYENYFSNEERDLDKDFCYDKHKEFKNWLKTNKLYCIWYDGDTLIIYNEKPKDIEQKLANEIIKEFNME